MIIYDIEDLVKIYPGQAQPANNHISLQIARGEIFGLLGANGAGKTTLVRQMVNLVSSTSGRIRFAGEEITARPLALATQVGYMPQESLALNNLTPGEALYFTAHLRGLSYADAGRERDRLLDLWQIGHLRDKYSPRMSGGERRLLRLAVAMAGRPPVLILDEPTNELDPARRKLTWDILRAANAQDAVTIIFITHDAIEAEKIIQRVGIMREGALVAVGRPGELKRQVDRKLRLELFFAPEAPPALPPDLPCHRVEPGRWLAFLDREQMAPVLSGLDVTGLHDLRLYSATLEDLYLHYTSGDPSAGAAASSGPANAPAAPVPEAAARVPLRRGEPEETAAAGSALAGQAASPAGRLPRAAPALPLQIWDLLRIELTNWRWSWRWLLIVGTLAPLGSMLGLGVFARDGGTAALGYVLTGNLVLALMFNNMDNVASRFAFMRYSGNLDYFATLPISKYVLILAVLLSFLALGLPSLAVTLLAGARFLGLSVAPHPLLAVVVPLCALPLAAIGALIGARVPNPQQSSSVTLPVTLVLLALGPVIVPPARLPAILLVLGRLSPATYAASALRQVLLGPVTPQISVDLAVLALTSAVALWLVARAVHWRQN